MCEKKIESVTKANLKFNVQNLACKFKVQCSKYQLAQQVIRYLVYKFLPSKWLYQLKVCLAKRYFRVFGISFVM